MNDITIGSNAVFNPNAKRGIIIGVTAHLVWGFLPLYWKLLTGIPPMDLLFWRILWAVITLGVLIIVIPKWRRTFFAESRLLIRSRSAKTMIFVACAAVLISVNWFFYIYAVEINQVSEASLGYFINPLVNFVLAAIFLKERPLKSGFVACAIAVVGVTLIAIELGSVPWISLVLAFTFGIYGLLKKDMRLQFYTSLMMETLIVLPIAIVYLIFFARSGVQDYSMQENLILIASGAATLLPLSLFGDAVKHVSYITTGFIQYLSPSINIVLAIFLLREPCPPLKLAGFIVIWIGIAVYSVGTVIAARRNSLPD